MAKQSDYEKHCLAQIASCENRAKKFNEAALKARLEAKAFKDALDWHKNVSKKKKEDKK